ncbi:hypothetical protein EXIGLDRAFT_756432 [Exidia glandulosa HHB12029]|uniref:Family A G protein-coupled receptor-like protein n=1 Tax=Exidia glandulosa HHB12029 TaxID=1314781 RepID=A0A165BAD0_EXIGL|nr:hypothetical protein EXIGLDRAFT_756432 [Exidia glandulosa HHB12029]
MFSYPPIGESPSDLWLERTVFAGGILVSFAFGLYLCITSACVYFMLCRAPRGKRNWPLLVYILVLSFSWISNWLWCQMVFIDDRAYPGGPPVFFIDHFNAWANTISDATLVINGVLADGFIIWRCYVIWDANRFVIAASILGYVASTGDTDIVTRTPTSFLTLWETALPGRNPWASVQYAIVYFSISLALNLMLTGLIVGRLLWHRRRLGRALGPDGYKSGKTYVSVAAVLIESAALYSATSVALIASFALGSYIAAWALPLLGEVMASDSASLSRLSDGITSSALHRC